MTAESRDRSQKDSWVVRQNSEGQLGREESQEGEPARGTKEKEPKRGTNKEEPNKEKPPSSIEGKLILEGGKILR